MLGAAAALLLASPLSSAAASELRGLIIAERDITRPGAAPQPAALPDSCPSRQDDEAQQQGQQDSAATATVASPDLPDAAAVAAYREQLKARGVVTATPALDNLDTDFISEQFAALIGQPIDQQRLQQINAILVNAVNLDANWLADIYLPPQRSDDGYLVAVVAPATAGSIVAEGQEHYEAEQLLCEIRTRPGERINLRRIAEDLQWMNRTPWRITNASYAAGERSGEADIVMTTQDRNLFRPYISGDNSGTRRSGRHRYKIGFSLGDPFGNFDHRIDYALSRSNVSKALESHSLSYNWPTEKRWSMTFNFAWAKNDVKLQNGLFRSSGENITVGLSANRVLSGFKRKPQWLHETTLGFEWKRVGSSLEFGQFQVQDATPELLHLYADYSFGASDSHGKFNSYSHLVLSPGLTFGNHSNEEFRQQRFESGVSYWYLKQLFDRTLRLPDEWSARALMRLQFANKPLPYSERTGMTGVNAVRGYYEDTLFADRGVIVNLEIATPNINVEFSERPGKLQFFIFRDWARSSNLTPEVNSDLGTTGHKNIVSSHGLGMRFTYAPFIQFLAIAGKPERGLQQRSRDWLGHISLVIGL